MKTTDNKLKNRLINDAKAFNKMPAKTIHDSIMQSIQANHQPKQKPQSVSIFNWLLPTGFVMAALVLVVINIRTVAPITQPAKQILTNHKMVKVPKINLDSITLALESNLISNFELEQKALKADFNYMKKLFTL